MYSRKSAFSIELLSSLHRHVMIAHSCFDTFVLQYGFTHQSAAVERMQPVEHLLGRTFVESGPTLACQWQSHACTGNNLLGGGQQLDVVSACCRINVDSR